MSLDTLLACGRQWLYPREFRISWSHRAGWAEILAEMARALTALQPPQSPTAPSKAVELKPDSQGTGNLAPIEPSFVRGLCNDLFRLRRNAALLTKEGSETKEVRSIQRAVERLDDMLKERGIEYFDLTGRPWDPRDIDFEPKGQPVPVSGLVRKRIAACECPLVKMNGRLIQRAQGIVEVPAEERREWPKNS